MFVGRLTDANTYSLSTGGGPSRPTRRAPARHTPDSRAVTSTGWNLCPRLRPARVGTCCPPRLSADIVQWKPNGSIEGNGSGKFSDLNETSLAAIKDMGFTHVWPTGVLQQATATDYSAIGEPVDAPDLLKGLAGSPSPRPQGLFENQALRQAGDICGNRIRRLRAASRFDPAADPVLFLKSRNDEKHCR